MKELIKKSLSLLIDIPSASNRLAPLKIFFLLSLAWVVSRLMLGRYISELFYLYDMTNDVLLVQRDEMIFFINPGLAGALVVIIGSAVMHILVYFNTINYNWKASAIIIISAIASSIMFLIIGLWAKQLSYFVISSGGYIVCPYGSAGYSRSHDYGGSNLYKFALLDRKSGLTCK
ncbi:hypothetical protein [Pseudomonas sp. PA27(2017)]|uniref:hypothetical protein n=1 Tax=Pseudomonas sp. PA27(2017) TaxID=1932112 RepID=UPI001115342A|nr:hypothetical protein [Pseudomonas sp. PA27(2017)]